MRLKIYLFLAFFYGIAVSGYTQFFKEYQKLNNREILGDLMLNVGKEKFLNPDDYKKDFEGSPFWKDKWEVGKIYLRKGQVIEATLLYDVLNQQMLIKKDSGILNLAQPHQIEKIVIDDHVFIFVTYEKSKIVTENYFEQLVTGNHILLKKYDCRIVKGDTQKSAYEGKVKDRFSMLKEYYTISPEQKAIVLPDSKKQFFHIFGDQKSAVEDYCKTQKLKYNKEDDLIKIFQHWNLLLQNT